MFSVKQIGFLILLTLLACSDDQTNYNPYGSSYNRNSVYNSPTGVGTGTPAGVAVLISTNAAMGVTQMTLNIFGTGGKSATTYNGSAQFNGSMTLSQNYRSSAAPTYSPHSPHSYQSSPAQQCPQGQIQFNCSGRLLNSTFTCEATLYGGSYRINGMLGQKQNTSQDYEIQSVQVLGPCTTPRHPGHTGRFPF